MIHDAKTMAELASAASPEPAVLANVSRRAVVGGLGAFVLALSLREPARAEDSTSRTRRRPSATK